jgi:hypothetical protein
VIRTSRPDVVTLNEVCRGDVRALARAMTAAEPDARVVSAFDAAADRRTGGPIRCVNGQPYGIGVLAGASTAVAGPRTFAGRYPIQDPTDPEERVWLCIHAEADSYACTTHTANTSTAVALAQCRYLLDVALPRVVGRGGMERVVVGADLNLPADASPGPGSCVPHGYRRADDGSRQDVVASVQYAITSHTDLDLHGTTDHPGLLVALVRR